MYRLAYEQIYGNDEYVEGTDPTPIAREGVEYVSHRIGRRNSLVVSTVLFVAQTIGFVCPRIAAFTTLSNHAFRTDG